jgi:hypothetical protein
MVMAMVAAALRMLVGAAIGGRPARVRAPLGLLHRA